MCRNQGFKTSSSAHGGGSKRRASTLSSNGNGRPARPKKKRKFGEKTFTFLSSQTVEEGRGGDDGFYSPEHDLCCFPGPRCRATKAPHAGYVPSASVGGGRLPPKYISAREHRSSRISSVGHGCLLTFSECEKSAYPQEAAPVGLSQSGRLPSTGITKVRLDTCTPSCLRLSSYLRNSPHSEI